MNKKNISILLGSLSIISIISPILVTVACSQASSIDLKITSNETQILTKEEVVDLKGVDLNKQLPVLEKLFSGVTSEKQKNFKVELSNENVVTLTANKGFLFIGKPTLRAPAFIIESPPVDKNLVITAITKPTSLTELEIFILQETDLIKQLLVLQKLFEGKDLKKENQIYFSVSVDTTKNIVTLKGRNDYTINSQPSLSSVPYTIITNNVVLNIAKTTSPKLLAIDITNLEGTDSSKYLPVLQKLFTGINETNIKNITFEFDKGKKIVTLTAKPGFVFDQENNTLVSNPFTIEIVPADKNLNITKILDPKLLDSDIAILQGTNITDQLSVLKKLFGGDDLNTLNQANFSVSIDTTKNIVTLTGKNNYTINGNNTLISNPYTIVTTNTVLNITKIVAPKLLAADIIVLEGTDTAKQLPILKKLFEGSDLNAQNQAHFFISSINIKNKIITLEAKPGYVFDQSSPKLDSNTYSIETIPSKNLIISAIPQAATLTSDEISTLEGKDFNASLPILKRLFTGKDLKVENKDNFSISIDSTNNIVTLIGEKGYLINNASSLSSTKYNNAKFPLVISKINQSVELTSIEVNTIESASTPDNANAQIAILAKLFIGIDNTNFANLSFSVNEKTNTVFLNANDGYFFGQANETFGPTKIESTSYIIKLPDSKNLSITAISESASLNASEITILEGLNLSDQLVILKKLFTGIDLIKESQPFFTISIDKGNKIITLTGKDGYTINSGTSLESTPYTLINSSLFIVPVYQAAVLSTREINLLNAPSTMGNYLQQIKVLNKLFSGIEVKNFYNFTFAVDLNTKKVTLTANYGYYFVSRPTDTTGNPTLDSIRFLICNPS
ncbi:MAG: hypothetical protein ACRDA7_01190 [Metamycoplasmataceae bacterium]